MVNLPKFFKEEGQTVSREFLPLLPLRDIVVFPHMVAPLFVGRTKSVNALSEAMSKDKRVFLATQKKAGVDNPGEKDISPIGVVGSVLQLLRLPDGTVKALVEGKVRGRITNFATKDDFFQVEIETLEDAGEATAEVVALGRAVVKKFEEYSVIRIINPKIVRAGNNHIRQNPDRQ